jgi:putative ABC transport system permease protein
MLISYAVRSDLLADWQQQLPERAPNHFALNIFPEQQTELAAYLQQRQIAASDFYPIVRGRLVAINDKPVQQIVSKDSQGERATQRDLSLTWTHQLPVENVLTAGAWWQDGATGQVSVEQKLAENLHLEIGDKLMFTVGSEQLPATVTSIRQVKWETMKPNFYMIFSPGTLDAYPTTLLTSFYLAPEQKPLLNGLLKAYPSITILEVDALLNQFKTILSQITAAINLLLGFALLAGFTVLFSAIYATLDERIYEGALLRTLGAERRLMRTAHALEFVILGVLASGLAIVLAESICFALYHWLLHIDYQAKPLRWLLTLGLGTLLIGLAGYRGTAVIVKTPPMRIFREL